MRYQITRTRRGSNELRSQQQASNTTTADGIFSYERGLASPGEEVVLVDTKDGGRKVLKSSYRDTPEDRARGVAKALCHWLDSELTGGANAVRELATKLRTTADAELSDPTYDFQWSERTFEAAGQLVVARWLVAAIVGDLRQDGAPPVSYDVVIGDAVTVTHADMVTLLDRLIVTATEQVRRGARSPSRSTSATSNLTDLYKTAAWARAEEMLLSQRSWLNPDKGDA